MKCKEVFPKDLFFPPTEKWDFAEDPLKKRLNAMESANSEAIGRALATNLTNDFITTLYIKSTRIPPENINIEIKGETRSGKSTGGIFLGNLISKWWGMEFTQENILPNQAELLYRLKDAKYGETFLVDEQTPETYGEGILRETEQLGMNLNICAKKCNNLIFVYPPHFTMRNAPYGLETVGKDTKNKHVKFFYHDLTKKAFGFGGIWPQGYVILPKYQDPYYQNLPHSKWSVKRKKNFAERGYDFDSQLEEDYEIKKDDWIEDVRNMDASQRNRKKSEIAETLANDDKFRELKNNGQREAYLQLLINNGKIMEMAKTELTTVVNMAKIIADYGSI